MKTTTTTMARMVSVRRISNVRCLEAGKPAKKPHGITPFGTGGEKIAYLEA
jgi:hypothetical protein